MASMRTLVRSLGTAALAVVLSGSAAGQEKPPVPRPFPQPSEPAQAKPVAPQPAPAAGSVPTEAMLGLPERGIYPNAQFITSYDAGQGQRYYLFGTKSAFAEVVAYYRTLLKDKGDLVFEEPPVHEFDIAKFKEETMAFPPSVTVKDYTWGNMGGYLNPKPGAQPQRFKTIIQVVPAPQL